MTNDCRGIAVLVVSTRKFHANQVLPKVVEHIDQAGYLAMLDYRVEKICRLLNDGGS